MLIPSGNTCTIQNMTNGVAFAMTIEVESGAGLKLYRDVLILGQDNTDTTSVLDGLITLQETSGENDRARIVSRGGWVTISGGGEINASKANGSDYSGVLRCCNGSGGDPDTCGYPGKGFNIGSGVRLRGSLRLRTCLELNGRAIVDHADDDMTLEYDIASGGGWARLCGTLCQGVMLVTGSGKFEVSDGDLWIGAANLTGATAPEWVLSGGTIHVPDVDGYDCTCTATHTKLTLTGGTLDFDINFSSVGGFSMKRTNTGQAATRIQVASGKTVSCR